jgi:acyl carrier protein
VDGDGNQVASGGLGEICVQSRYLSQGYWKQPELTRARFRPDPSRGESRIYLTGDLGRIHPDGCLEHLGRKDSQVKLRGFRIEKQEIEALLNEHPSIREAVVEVEKDANEEGRLVGYLVLHEGQTVRLGDLRNYLKDRLPQYMVPSSIVFLKALPRTANGKIDRRALAAIEPDVKVSEHGISKPRNATEKKLIKIWETVLGIRPVGVRDNFFDLGGQSLLAIQLMGKIKKVFGRQWSAAILYQAPTVEQLAELLRQDAAHAGILNFLRSFFG